MALQPCEQVNNIHEGIIYRKEFPHTAGSSGITYQDHYYWLAQQFNTFLDTLPDGYYMVIHYFATASIIPTVYDTTNPTTSPYVHQVELSLGEWHRTGQNQLQPRLMVMNPTDPTKCFGKAYTLSDSGSISMSDLSSSILVQPNTTRNERLIYTLYKLSTDVPTD